MGASQSITRASLSYARSFRKPLVQQSTIFGTRIVVPFSKYSKFSESLTKTEDYPKELDILKPLSQVHINQTKVADHGLSVAVMDNMVSTVELDVVSKKDVPLFSLVYARGPQPEEHKIDVFGVGEDKLHIADMDLERSVQYRGLILCVKSPPGNLLCQVYELPGISQIAIARNYRTGETMFQILMNGEFGWSESAQILSSRGDRKVGRLYKRHEKITKRKNALNASIHMPTDLNVAAKLTLIGFCLHLMGRYHN